MKPLRKNNLIAHRKKTQEKKFCVHNMHLFNCPGAMDFFGNHAGLALVNTSSFSSLSIIQTTTAVADRGVPTTSAVTGEM